MQALLRSPRSLHARIGRNITQLMMSGSSICTMSEVPTFIVLDANDATEAESARVELNQEGEVLHLASKDTTHAEACKCVVITGLDTRGTTRPARKERSAEGSVLLYEESTYQTFAQTDPLKLDHALYFSLQN